MYLTVWIAEKSRIKKMFEFGVTKLTI